MKKYFILFIISFTFINIISQTNPDKNQFRQLHTLLPDANSYRTASGAPGYKYWQQKADYNIKIILDDNKHTISGEETITYHNQSPDNLNYLWVQLDQNIRAKNSLRNQTQTGEISEEMSAGALRNINFDFDGGFKIDYVKDIENKDIKYTVNNTMMRIDLPKPLKSGEVYSLKIKWWYNINNRDFYRGRSGMEYFPTDDNYLYTIAQFYPRMVLYTDYAGWQNKQFLGSGEFTLTFGDFDVEITVPADHTVSATGKLINENEVLSKEQIARLEKAKTAKEPIIIISQKEAEKKEKIKLKTSKTWKFKAENVRDFGFASSRKFIWDAIGVPFGERTVMAMSFYPKEGNPLWGKFSTKVVAHTIRNYSKYTFDYPYPTAQSINAKAMGMEYPMICFNFGRPDKQGNYSERTKYGMIGVIIHEVGHNFFPMIVNSDERQWTWMDEGLNTFLQHLTQKAWSKTFPSRNGSPELIVDYMRTNKSGMTPIMFNPEISKSHHNTQYGKPSAALNILRETVMGRELFDFAFKEYANRWKFKHPTPADFFRTMEDASAVDLDWFWRGWFYSTDHVDMKISNVQIFKLANGNPAEKKAWLKNNEKNKQKTIMEIRDANVVTEIDKDSKLIDIYDTQNPYKAVSPDKTTYKNFTASLSDEEKKFINSKDLYLQIEVENIGGLIMPLIFKFEYTDGSSDIIRVPVEVWRYDNNKLSKIFLIKKDIKTVILDPYGEIADTDMSNNYWPQRVLESRFELYKRKKKL